MIMYIHDLARVDQIKSSLRFGATCAVQMIQAISQNRGNKKLTKTDLFYIMHAAFFPYDGGDLRHYSYYGGRTRQTNLPTPCMQLWYFKGTDTDQAKLIWCFHARCKESVAAKYTFIDIEEGHRGGFDCSSGKVMITGQIYNTKDMLNFSIKKDEVKILVELSFDSWIKNGPSSLSNLERWGLWIYEPPSPREDSGDTRFNTYLVFSPNPGLFDEAGPQD